MFEVGGRWAAKAARIDSRFGGGLAMISNMAVWYVPLEDFVAGQEVGAASRIP